jgi:hypothetical protein
LLEFLVVRIPVLPVKVFGYANLKLGVKIENLELGAGEMFRVGKRSFGTGFVVDVMRCHPEPTPIAPEPDDADDLGPTPAAQPETRNSPTAEA